MNEYVSESGAKRSKRMPRFDLIPRTVLVCLADRLQVGLDHGYAENNWQKATSPVDMDFMKDGLNHIQHHLSSLMNGDFEEDNEWGHLGAIMFGCMMRACALEKQGDLTELHPAYDTRDEVQARARAEIQAMNEDDNVPF